MHLSIKSRLYILAIVPLVLISVCLMLLVYSQLDTLNQSQMTATQNKLMAQKQQEVRSYMEIVQSSMAPLIARNASREEAIEVLSAMKYGNDGYIFGYDSGGVRWFSGSSTAGIGNNYWNLKDNNGFALIQNIIREAKNGGGFTTYYFPKPGDDTPYPKLSYSVYLPDWDLAIGTGFYIDDVEATIQQMNQASQATMQQSLNNTLMLTAVIAVLVALLAMLINRSILHPLSLFDRSVASFARGEADLTARIVAFNVPEFKRLGENFNTFVANLQDIIRNVADVSSNVVNEAGQMADRAAQVDQLTSGQQQETEQVASAITEMTSTAQEISANAVQAAQAAGDVESTNSAMDIVQAAAHSVEALAGDVAEANQVISQLEKDVQGISSSLDVIQDIAEQTNLLALNAAIEAARAGEQGRGFAVVADEVRNLASRTQDSTQEIHSMIEKLKSASDAAVRSMEVSQEKSLQTVEEANAATGALEQIQSSVGVINQMGALIATATEEQNQVGQEISQRIVLIADQTSHSAQLANENRAGSLTLTSKAEQLSGLVSRFTV